MVAISGEVVSIYAENDVACLRINADGSEHTYWADLPSMCERLGSLFPGALVDKQLDRKMIVGSRLALKVEGIDVITNILRIM